MANTTDKSILTAAGKALLAQLNAEEKPLIIDKMIFANVPNRPEFPQPDDVVPTDHVVHQEGVEQRGRLSADSVIYSTTLTSDVGPFEFNWTGAYCSEYGVLVTIDHHALTPKSADEPGVAGNTLVRSVVLEYKDIAEITNITVDASSWQYNATPRMKKMDDDVAQAIIDQNGKDWFIEDGFLVTPQASAFKIKAGAGYVSGNRVTLEFDRNVQVPNKPSFIYVDAHREGTPTGEQVTLFDFVITAEEKDDYTDAGGVKHFVCKIAQVLADGSVSDLRPEGESASRNWTQKEDHKTVEKTTLLTIFPESRDLSVGDVILPGIDGLQINGMIYGVDGIAVGTVEHIDTENSQVVVSGKTFSTFARDLEISSVEQLIKTKAVHNQSAFVKAYHAGWAAVSDSPSGGGWFKFTNETDLVENGGTIVKGIAGFWVRGYKDSYTPEDFGAIGVKNVRLDENNIPIQSFVDSSEQLNALFASVDTASLPSNYGFENPLIFPKVGIKIRGKGLYKNGLYQTKAFSGALIQTDPDIERMWDFDASDFFISAIGGTDVTGFRLNNPNGRCNVKRIRWTRTTFLRVNGTAFQVKRNTGEAPELIDGYFSTTEDCFVQQWAYGYNYDGTDQFVNAHWNNRCTATDGGVGWWCKRSNSIRITNPHGELLDTAILNQDSNDLEVSGGYFERNRLASIRNQNSNACRYHNNLFSSSGFGNTTPESGAGVLIESGHQNTIKNNFFNEKFIDAHVRIGAGAINTLVIDNSVKRRDIHGGWQSDKLSIIDEGINTIFKGIVKNNDGSFSYIIKNVELDSPVLNNANIKVVFGDLSGEAPVIVAARNITPWDAAADLPGGSIYIQTGNYIKLYQRKAESGELINDWHEFN